MPGRKPLPKREQDIGERILSFRVGLGVTRVAFARKFGVKASTLRSYEEGRARLPFDLADRICREFDISQEWLANESGTVQGYFVVMPLVLAQIRDGAPFTEGYDRLLQKGFARRRQLEAAASTLGLSIRVARKQDYPIEGSEAHEVALREAMSIVQGTADGLPPELWTEFSAAILRAVDQFIRRHSLSLAGNEIDQVSVPETTSAAPTPRKESSGVVTKLDTSSGSGYSSDTAMKNLWKPWQKRLANVCDSPGVRARLAREFNVSRQAASNWVSGVSEPTADYALNLVEWIKREEARE